MERRLGHFPSGGFLEQFVDEGLVGLRLLGGEAADLRQQSWLNADRDELLGAAGPGPSNSAGALQFLVGGFRNVGEINAAIRHMLCALCGSPAVR